jgi:hypothetical protein
VGVNSLVVVLEDLILINLNQIEGNIVSIGLNRVGEILNDERCFRNLQELNRQSKLSCQYKNLDNLFWDDVLAHIFKEAQSLLMGKDDVGIYHVHLLSLVLDHDGEEIQEFDNSLLVLVYLSMFYRNKLISNIVSNMEHAIGLQEMGNHLDVVQLQENQAIVSVNVEIWVSRESHFEFFVFFALGDEPAVVDELSSVLKIWVHDYGHEIVHLDHLDEKVIKRVVEVISTSDLLGCISSISRLLLDGCTGTVLFVDLVVLSDSLIKSMVPVGHGKESNCRSILDQFKKVFVILNGLLGQLIVHRC